LLRRSLSNTPNLERGRSDTFASKLKERGKTQKMHGCRVCRGR
jgi:hypothetical protein